MIANKAHIKSGAPKSLRPWFALHTSSVTMLFDFSLSFYTFFLPLLFFYISVFCLSSCKIFKLKIPNKNNVSLCMCLIYNKSVILNQFNNLCTLRKYIIIFYCNVHKISWVSRINRFDTSIPFSRKIINWSYFIISFHVYALLPF